MEIKAPRFPESIQEGTLSRWHKKEGEAVTKGVKLADIETDKIVLEVMAEADGVIGPPLIREGGSVRSNQTIGSILGAGEAPPAAPAPEPVKPAAAAPAPAAKPAAVKPVVAKPAAPAPTLTAAATAVSPVLPILDELPPAVRRLVIENKLDISAIQGSGRNGQVTKADVIRHIEHSPNVTKRFGDAAAAPEIQVATPPPSSTQATKAARPEQRVKMTRLRARIAERLVQAQHNAAILTTFNEVNMQPVMELRAKYKEQFEKTHGAKLGFMSFFVKAAIEGLTKYPVINASVDGDEIVYHGYYNLGMAVSSPRGLVVPVVNDADQLTFAGIEKKIVDFGKRAQEGKLEIDELQGGTFTISNGGVFGSMLSTPILNPPQSAILGLHRIQERPVAENGQVVIRPMMYLALSYDHRIIDGREAVLFLVAVKEAMEDPARLLLNL